ncbi:MAG TPA: hypothetical protein VNJ09_08240 [Chthonomonadales bacterium]|nr:hypothetical protein [Chthonomonadales bacterium]
MAFVIGLAFATEQDRADFVERIMPRVRGKEAEPPRPEGEEDGLHWMGIAVTSQSAARDLCHQLVAFLAHSKKTRVDVTWRSADGQLQTGQVTAEAAREAEILSVRLGAAAKAHLDAEKNASEG